MIRFFCILFLAFSLGGCATIYNPATARHELILIDTQSEIVLGRDIDQQIKKDFVFLRDYNMQARIDSIGKRVALASDRQDLNYKFSIIKDDEFNAFAVPGGFIYVNSGLINAANDDELACVLAHEIGHIAARHSVKRLQANLGYQLLMGIALGKSGSQAISQAAGITYNVVALGFNRQDEFLADKLAVKYSSAAGYNPYGMVTFFKKLEENKKPGLELVFLSSHPPVKDRIEQVEKEIALIR
ncbi:MAG: M48 family metalloprotease [Candidatus Omnitrophica bacterium]|nr:M48 family metalloprotease [Candidatus Omnitrophota bacterium]